MTSINPQVYDALRVAAHRIGMAANIAGVYRVKRDRRGKVVQGYRLTEAHQQVIDTLNDYCRGNLTDEEAMAVLNEYDVFMARA